MFYTAVQVFVETDALFLLIFFSLVTAIFVGIFPHHHRNGGIESSG